MQEWQQRLLMLMGSDVPPRRAFIHAHANEAEIDA